MILSKRPFGAVGKGQSFLNSLRLDNCRQDCRSWSWHIEEDTATVTDVVKQTCKGYPPSIRC